MGETDRLIEMMMDGDARCPYQIGTLVFKTYCEDDDAHAIGTEGIVKGNHMIDGKEDVYLVQFEDNKEGVLTFVVGQKLSNVSPILN
jgi:hypothetical protein